MNKIVFLLFIVAFFLDFSFIPNFLGSELGWPYMVLSLLIAIFLFNKNTQKNIGWGILAALALNILLPLNFFGYILIVIIIWGAIYFLENIFFNEGQSYLKSNFTFIINFVLFGVLFFVGQYIKAKILGESIFTLQNVDWWIFSLKLFIGIIIYNLSYRIVYKLCGKNTLVLK